MQGLSLPLSSWHLTSVLLGDLEETHHFDCFVVWLDVLQKKCTVDAKHDIAKLVEHRTGNAEVTGSNPVEA